MKYLKKFNEGFKDWFRKKSPPQQKDGIEILKQLEQETDPDDVYCDENIYHVSISNKIPPIVLSSKMCYDRRLINPPEMMFSVKINDVELCNLTFH